ncbi:MAG: tetratricopeptide repeat protein [Chitinophagaceae bacterium]
MSDKKVHVEVSDPMLKAKSFWMKYQKPILGVVTGILLIIIGWYAYQNWFVQPKEEQAEDAVFKAQQYFAMDSLNQALNGDGISKGFLYIIKNYDGTKTANLAHYYAGVCYLRIGNFNKAVEYLKDFSTDAKQVQMMAYGCLGDAYSELKKNDDAINYYKKAATTFESDEINSSEYLFRAALLEETLGKNKEAVDLYKQIKDKFPKTRRAFEADKYIYRLGIEPNDFSVK